MEEIKVLFGFSDAGFEKAVKDLLKTKGYDAQIVARFSKESVKKYIEKNPDTKAVVLLEAFPKGEGRAKPQKYTAEEVTELTDMSDVNVIFVLSENYKGTDYMRTLFAAGITSAFFQNRKDGARPRDIASLILQKRTRKAAREYYGIGAGKIELGFMETVDFNGFYEQFKKAEVPLMGYLSVCSKLNAQQIADFTRRLPEDDKSYLAGFEEFHTVMQLLKKFGIDMKIKRPRKVVIGLANTPAITMQDDKIVVEQPGKEMPEKSKEEPVAEPKSEDKPEEKSEELAKAPSTDGTPKSYAEEREEETKRLKEQFFKDAYEAFGMGSEETNTKTPEEPKQVADKEMEKASEEPAAEVDIEAMYAGLSMAELLMMSDNLSEEEEAIETNDKEPQADSALPVSAPQECKEEPAAVIEQGPVEETKEESETSKEEKEETKEPEVVYSELQKAKKVIPVDAKATQEELAKILEDEDEENVTLQPIEFDTLDYDDIVLLSGPKKRSSLYIVIVLMFALLVAGVYLYGNGYLDPLMQYLK